ncbi:TonB-dependent receptor [candidate division KSB1 bacterium]
MRRLTITASLILLLLYVYENVYSQGVEAPDDTLIFKGDEISVIASKYPSVRGDISVSLYVINEEEINNAIGNSVLELIDETVPGVTLTQKSVLGYGIAEKAAGAINIRGVGGKPNTGVLVLVDGRPDFMGIFGHPISDAYQLENIEKVEVIKGPVSVLYGTNAMGGVINIITKKNIEQGLKNSITMEYGSFNTYRTKYTNEGRLDKFKYYISAGIDGTDGHRENANYNSQTYSAKTMYDISDNWDFSISGSTTKFEMNDPGTVTSPTADGWYHVRRNWFDVSVSNSTRYGSGEFKVHANTGHHEIYDGWRSNDKTYGLMFYQHIKPFIGTTITGGFDYKKMGGDAANMLTNNDFGTNYEYQYGSYFHIQQVLLKNIVASTGVRIEKIYDRNSEIIPKFGLVCHINDYNSIKANIAKGFRAPTIRELYLFPPSNTEINPEEMWNYELGYNLNTKIFKINSSVFTMKGTNLIRIAGDFPNMAFRNTGRFIHKGIEFNLTLNPIETVSLTGGYCLLDADDQTQYNPGSKLNLKFKYHKGDLRWEIFSQSLWDRYGSDFAQNRLDQFVIFDSRISYKLNKHVTLIGKINNITDKEYQIMSGYPMPGRYFSLGFKFLR